MPLPLVTLCFLGSVFLAVWLVFWGFCMLLALVALGRVCAEVGRQNREDAARLAAAQCKMADVVAGVSRAMWLGSNGLLDDEGRPTASRD